MLQFVQFSAGVFLNIKVIKIIFTLIKLGLNETFNNIETPFNTSKETYDNKQKIFFFLLIQICHTQVVVASNVMMTTTIVTKEVACSGQKKTE